MYIVCSLSENDELDLKCQVKEIGFGFVTIEDRVLFFDLRSLRVVVIVKEANELHWRIVCETCCINIDILNITGLLIWYF